jgi:hypothetical protein
MAGHVHYAPERHIALAVLRLAPFVVFAAWVAVACYALAYLVGR